MSLPSNPESTGQPKRPRTGGLHPVADHESTALTPAPNPAQALSIWSPEQVQLIKELICPGASDDELKLFAVHCRRTGLDPFSRQTYGIVRYSNVQQTDGSWKRQGKLTIQNAIDGLRLIADRTGKYGGQIGPQWCGPDGVWKEVWLADEYPSAARVSVIRTDWAQPLTSVARWSSYVQTYYDSKARQHTVTQMWDHMPDLMLGKVAEALALRRAFPQELSSVYGEEEMAQADRWRSPDDDPRRPVIVGTARPVPNPQPTGDAPPPPPPPPPPTDEKPLAPKLMAQFEASWARGIEAARVAGVDPLPEPPPPGTATRSVVSAALADLAERIERVERQRSGGRPTVVEGDVIEGATGEEADDDDEDGQLAEEEEDPDGPW